LRLLVRRESQLVFSINWLIGTRSVFALANDRRESPHKLPVSIFKEQPRASAEADRELCGILQFCQHRPADISAGAPPDPTTG